MKLEEIKNRALQDKRLVKYLSENNEKFEDLSIYDFRIVDYTTIQQGSSQAFISIIGDKLSITLPA